MEWHNVLDPNGPELDELAKRYNLHPLHIEDCRHRGQNAKIEEGETYLFTVLKAVRPDPDRGLHVVDLDIFLGRDYLITVIEEDCPEMRDIVDRARKAPQANNRPDQAYYRVVDMLVDSYLPILDKLADTIDELEDEALAAASPETLSKVFSNKRILIVLRRVLVNTRDVATHLQRTESPYIHRDLWPFLRDVYDHVARNLDTVEMLRDLLNGTLDVYLSSVANRTNQVMKVLTVLGTIALPAIVVSGIYGMNVKGLPFAEKPHATALVFGVMAAITAFLLWALKKFRWL